MAGRYKKGETSPQKRIEQAFKTSCLENKLQALIDAKKKKYGYLHLSYLRNLKRNKLSLDSVLKWEEADNDIHRVSYGTLKKHPKLMSELESALDEYNTEIYGPKSPEKQGRRKSKSSATGMSKNELKDKVIAVAKENQMLLDNLIIIYRMYEDLKSTIPKAEQNEVHYQRILKRHAKGLKRFKLQLVVDNERE